ncbi:unnamed protein product, partial [Mesorhabditis spiculigera]
MLKVFALALCFSISIQSDLKTDADDSKTKEDFELEKLAEKVLRPYVDGYKKAVYDKKWDEVAAYYHPEALLIDSGKTLHHTPEVIVKTIKANREALGDSQTVTTNERFSGGGDVFLYRNIWTLNNGNETLTGPYLQIWIRDSGKIKLYHDEFSFTERKPNDA